MVIVLPGWFNTSCCEQFSTRRILNAKAPEPGGLSIWSAEGNRASNRLTNRPATQNRIWIRARPLQRDCAGNSVQDFPADEKADSERAQKSEASP
jgi:hypothetical protein